MKEKLSKSRFTTIGPDQIWMLYRGVSGIFRGGGSTSSPKLVRADGPRRTDLVIMFDQNTNQEMVYPSSNKGLSFADSIEVLARKRIEGYVWVIPKGETVPEGLIFNVKDIDHPLLNVSHVMSVLDTTARLTQLGALMQPCEIEIDKNGKIIEKTPGALMKARKQW